MSRYLKYILFLCTTPVFAGEAVLIPKKSGENIYVKAYEVSKNTIRYTDCNDGSESKPSDSYTIMNDNSACLAVSFVKQMDTIRLALKTTLELPEISNVIIEYRKMDSVGFKNKEEILLGYQNTAYSKVGQVKEGDRFNLIFYINDGKGCKEKDPKALQDKLVKLGFSENYFRLVKNKGSNDCEK